MASRRSRERANSRPWEQEPTVFADQCQTCVHIDNPWDEWRELYALIKVRGEPATIEDNSQNWAGMDGAVLRMPMDMALGNDIGRLQYYQRVQGLLDRLDGIGLEVKT